MLGSWPSNPLLSASPAHEDAEGTLAQVMTSPGYDVEAWDDILQNRLVFLQKLHMRRRVTKPGRTSPNSLTRLSSGFQGSKGYRVGTGTRECLRATVCDGGQSIGSTMMNVGTKVHHFGRRRLRLYGSWQWSLLYYGVSVIYTKLGTLHLGRLPTIDYELLILIITARDESEPKRQEVLKNNFPCFWLLFLRIVLTRHRLPVISFSRHLVSLHRSSCLEVIPNRCLCLSRTPARKRCKRLMAETDGFVATTSDGFLVDQRIPLNEKSQRFLRTWKSTTNMYFRGLQSAPLVVKTRYCAFCGRGYDRMTETFGEDDVIISSWPGYTFVLVNAVAYAVLTALETHYTDVLAIRAKHFGRYKRSGWRTRHVKTHATSEHSAFLETISHLHEVFTTRVFIADSREFPYNYYISSKTFTKQRKEGTLRKILEQQSTRIPQSVMMLAKDVGSCQLKPVWRAIGYLTLNTDKFIFLDHGRRTRASLKFVRVKVRVVMDWIPVEEVLKRLPAVALWRARAVCKKWKDLIETPGFAALHYTQHLNRSPPHVLGQDLDSEGPLFRCNPFTGQEASDWVLMEHNMDRVLNSSGGLILGMRGKDFMVWNPLTGASKMLPPLYLDGEPCSKETAMGMDFSGERYWACVLRDMEQGVMIYVYDSGKTGLWNEVLVPSETLFDTIFRDNKLYIYCIGFSGDVEVLLKKLLINGTILWNLTFRRIIVSGSEMVHSRHNVKHLCSRRRARDLVDAVLPHPDVKEAACDTWELRFTIKMALTGSAELFRNSLSFIFYLTGGEQQAERMPRMRAFVRFVVFSGTITFLGNLFKIKVQMLRPDDKGCLSFPSSINSRSQNVVRLHHPPSGRGGLIPSETRFCRFGVNSESSVSTKLGGRKSKRLRSKRKYKEGSYQNAAVQAHIYDNQHKHITKQNWETRKRIIGNKHQNRRKRLARETRSGSSTGWRRETAFQARKDSKVRHRLPVRHGRVCSAALPLGPAESKAVHRFITVLRNGEKLEVASELSDLPEVQRMAYSATYIGYINSKNNDELGNGLCRADKLGVHHEGTFHAQGPPGRRPQSRGQDVLGAGREDSAQYFRPQAGGELAVRRRDEHLRADLKISGGGVGRRDTVRFLRTWKSTTNMYFRGSGLCRLNSIGDALHRCPGAKVMVPKMRLNEVTVALRKKDTPGNCGKASRYCAAPSEQSILEYTREVAAEPDMRKRMQHLNTQLFLKQSHIFTKCLLLESSLPILEVTGIGWQRMVSMSIWETVDRWIYAENVLELMGMAYLHENAWRFT
ncbi:hypothetical protein SELMODRAFT_411058 [Selaginella moellendorffii]|uniref:F-box domain-containing protein n=1 Tax=Selaginella moellendorffii TaxID=88036 RepID=D8RGG4_SELML|nr:hypothetical protein SELMODRAFT_411058 [Selaginella moellendorffii]